MILARRQQCGNELNRSTPLSGWGAQASLRPCGSTPCGVILIIPNDNVSHQIFAFGKRLPKCHC